MSFFRRYFFVDYENVNIAGLNGISQLTAEDSVSIFYSDFAQTLTFDYHNKINSSPADIELISVGSGERNALDFQLSSFLGFLISENRHYFPDEEISYYIISHDKGYLCLKNFWKKKGTLVGVYSDLSLSRKTSDDLVSSAERPQPQLGPKQTDPPPITVPPGCRLNGGDINYILNAVDGDLILAQEIVQLSAAAGTKSDLNGLLIRYYKNTKKASAVHSLIKYLFA